MLCYMFYILIKPVRIWVAVKIIIIIIIIIIYRLVVRNPVMMLFSVLIFFVKMGVATMRAPYGLGPPTRPKNSPARWTFWANRYLEIFRGEPPAPLPEHVP